MVEEGTGEIGKRHGGKWGRRKTGNSVTDKAVKIASVKKGERQDTEDVVDINSTSRKTKEKCEDAVKEERKNRKDKREGLW